MPSQLYTQGSFVKAGSEQFWNIPNSASPQLLKTAALRRLTVNTELFLLFTEWDLQNRVLIFLSIPTIDNPIAVYPDLWG